jgi:hypothetical protein
MQSAAATAAPIPNRPLKWQLHEGAAGAFTINQLDHRGFSHLVANVSGASIETAHMLKAAPELLRGVEAAIATLDGAFAREQSPVVIAALRQLRKVLAAARPDRK